MTQHFPELSYDPTEEMIDRIDAEKFWKALCEDEYFRKEDLSQTMLYDDADILDDVCPF